MSLDEKAAAERARRALPGLVGRRLDVEPVRELPPPGAYGFDPEGWLLFEVVDRQCGHVGGSDYIGVHAETGETRHLGRLGE